VVQDGKSLLGANGHEFLERLAKLGVEDCVDDRVDERVHVAKPRSEDEGGHPWLTGESQFGAHCVHDVAREKRHPAKQKYP